MKGYKRVFVLRYDSRDGQFYNAIRCGRFADEIKLGWELLEMNIDWENETAVIILGSPNE